MAEQIKPEQIIEHIRKWSSAMEQGQKQQIIERIKKSLSAIQQGGMTVEELVDELWPVPSPSPEIICLCGSTRFTMEMSCISWALERDEGCIVLGWHVLPDNHPDLEGPFIGHHAAENCGKKEHFDELHKRKIDLCHKVLVINIGGYIGEGNYPLTFRKR